MYWYEYAEASILVPCFSITRIQHSSYSNVSALSVETLDEPGPVTAGPTSPPTPAATPSGWQESRRCWRCAEVLTQRETNET
jgi:hypothetical protein